MIPTRLFRSAPLFAFVAILTMGSAWMIRPVPGGTAPVPPMPKAAPVLVAIMTTPVPRPEPVRVHPADIAALREHLAIAEKTVREAQASVEIPQAELEALQKKVEELRAELKTLESKRTTLAAAAHDLPPEDQSLAAKVQQERARADSLESDLTKLRAVQEADLERRKFHTSVAARSTLPMPVEL